MRALLEKCDGIFNRKGQCFPYIKKKSQNDTYM